jgi:hypothetical protein
MTIRSEKYNKQAQAGAFSTIEKNEGDLLRKSCNPFQIDSDATLNYYRLFGEVEARKFRITELQELILSNLYHYRCIDQNMKSSVGKGYEDDTDPAIIEACPKKELRQIVTEYLSYGESWLELTILNGQVLNVGSIPTMSVHIGKKGKYAGKMVQNYKAKNEVLLEILDPIKWEFGRVKNGVYAYQIKHGRKIYGFPEWVTIIELLKIMKYSNEDIAAFFENDCLPYQLLVTHGLPETTSKGEDLIDFLERQFQGAKEKRKVAIVSTGLSPQESKVDVIELQKKIVNADNAALQMESKFDICAQHGVPYWILQLRKPGSLGQSNEQRISFNFYITEYIKPLQELFIEVLEFLFPNKRVSFKTHEFPEIEETSFNIEEMKSSFNNYAQGIIEAKQEIDLYRPNK